MKSISKLIVAGLSLAVSLAASATPQNLQKTFRNKQSRYNVSAATKLPTPATKQVKSLKGLTRADAARGNRVYSVNTLSPTPKRMAPAMHAPDSGSPLYGMSIYSDDASAMPNGIYQISTNSNELSLKLEGDIDGGACIVDGKYIVTALDEFWGYIFGGTIYVVDMDTWEYESIEFDLAAPDFANHFASAMTFDPTTNMIYGCFNEENFEGYVFGAMDPETYETDVIADLPNRFEAVSATADGQIYGIDNNGILYSIDKGNGSLTYIGSTGYAPAYTGGGAIDPATNVLYWALSPMDLNGYLMAVDINTAETEQVCQFEYNNEIVGLAFPMAASEPVIVPGALTDFDVNFEGILRTGTVSFTMPTHDSAGEAYNRAMDWTVERNGQVIKTGREFAGLSVSFADVVPATGNYTYRAYASNDNGKGATSKATLWIGPENPVTPENAKIVYDNNTFNVTWDAVDAPDYQGDVVYRVRFYKDGIMVDFVETTDTHACFTYNVGEMLTSYFVTVEAVCGTAVSDLGVTSSVVLGHANTPYIEEFDNADSLAAYTVIDFNADGRTWTLTTDGYVRCPYNGSEDMDDWLITPAIRLEAGKQYTFAFGAAAQGDYYPERVEALMGNAPTAEAMTSILVDPVTVTGNDFVDHSATFVCQETGDYYFGIHGISDADQYYLKVDYISVSAGMSTKAPAVPVASAEADATGALNLTITYTVPALDIAGNPCDVSKVVIASDGETVVENTDVTPGETYTANITVDEDGLYTYTVTAYNAYGAGNPAVINVYVGINRPAVPENVAITEISTGTVLVTWDAVTTDVNGNAINPANVTYTVVYDQMIVDITPETSCEFVAVPSGQEFVYVAVYAETAAGYSEEGGYSNMIPVGEPYKMPWIESFDEAGLSYPLGADGDGEWSMVNDGELGLDDYDGTNGLLAMEGSSVGDYGDLFLPMVALDANAATFSFAYYGIADDNTNYIDVIVNDCATGEATTVKHVVCNEGVDEWNLVTVSLAPFAGKTVYITLECVVMKYAYVLIDQLAIYEPAEYDLAATAISAPATVTPGLEFDVEVSVMNQGQKDIDAYTVELINNGKVVAKAEAAAIAAGAKATVTIPYTLTALDDASNYMTAKVVYEADGNADNDLSPETSVLLEMPVYPTATDLKAVAADGVALSWTAPDLSPANMPMVATTEDFESWTPLGLEGENGWLLVDNDGHKNPQVGIPGYDETATSYCVFNTVLLGIDNLPGFEAHSGVQYLESMYTDFGQNSDWAITPELYGKSQIISFWAKSYSASYPESFAVHYSTTDTEISSFELIDTYEFISDKWTKYSVLVPEGTKYFAIECTSNDRYYFMLDDVTYIPADAETLSLELVGYNIYRNGVKINEAPVTETAYVDAEGSASDVYVVTVVYAEGESAASNEASVSGVADPEVSGITDTVAGTKVSVEHRTIVVTDAAARVSVYNAEGKMVYSAAPATRNAITVTPGVYVVNSGRTVSKVIVK